MEIVVVVVGGTDEYVWSQIGLGQQSWASFTMVQNDGKDVYDGHLHIKIIVVYESNYLLIAALNMFFFTKTTVYLSRSITELYI